MATLRDVKRKINSIRSTQTITRTMRMISASKLRRAQDELEKITAYALKMEEVLKRMASRVPEQSHPLFLEREEIKKVLLFAIASDRGLSGAFNLNVANAVERFVRENRAQLREDRRLRRRQEDQGLPETEKHRDDEGMGRPENYRFRGGRRDGPRGDGPLSERRVRQGLSHLHALPLRHQSEGDVRGVSALEAGKSRRGPGLSLRARHAVHSRPLHPSLSVHENLFCPRGVTDFGTRFTDGGNGECDEQLRRDDRSPHPCLQQNTPAEHYQRNDGYCRRCGSFAGAPKGGARK